jgi:flavorubredoxin
VLQIEVENNMLAFKVIHQIMPGIYWVGVEDWNRRIFDALIPLPLGTSYNAYLLVEKEKIALIDTVQRDFADEMLQRIRNIVDPAKIDYVIMNHAEPDHAGSIPNIMSLARNANLVVTKLGVEMARTFYDVPSERILMVKEGDTLGLGGKTLKFIDAPWLHWPETMFTYCVEDKILFPCDFFGAHIASGKLYDDEVGDIVLPDAKRYYAEIMMPFPVAIQRALDKVKTLDLKMIAPSHGPIYRNPRRILDAYEMWARGSLKQKVVVAYVTMWGSTEALEKVIVESIASEGIETVPYNLLVADISHVMTDLVDASAIVIGAPTVLSGAHPIALMATEIVRALKPRTKLAAVFGSYGWGRGAVKMITERLQQSGFEILETLEVRGPPKKEDLEKAAILGRHVAQKIKEGVET